MEIGALWPFGRRRREEAAREAGSVEPVPAAEDTRARERAAPPPPAAETQPPVAVEDELRARRAEIARMEEHALRQAESIKVQTAEPTIALIATSATAADAAVRHARAGAGVLSVTPGVLTTSSW